MATPQCCIPDCERPASLGAHGKTNRKGRCPTCAFKQVPPPPKPKAESETVKAPSPVAVQPKPAPAAIPLVYDATDEQMDAVLAGIALSDDVNPSVRVQAAQARKGGKIGADLAGTIAGVQRKLLTFPSEEVDNERRRAV